MAPLPISLSLSPFLPSSSLPPSLPLSLSRLNSSHFPPPSSLPLPLSPLRLATVYGRAVTSHGLAWDQMLEELASYDFTPLQDQWLQGSLRSVSSYLSQHYSAITLPQCVCV